MPNRFPTVPLIYDKWEEWCRQLALSINALLVGKSNNLFEVTLAVSPATTTVIANTRITPETRIFLTATTATAAAAVGGLFVTASTGAITLNHAANAATDRTYAYILVG